MPVYPYEGITPRIADDAWIAPGAQVVGDVEIGARSSLWYNVVARGDVAAIRIGEGSNVQDGTVIHVTGGAEPTMIGDHVLIGHLAMIHACKLLDHSFVGLGAIVMDGCVIDVDGMLGAGALLTPGKRIGKGELWLGRPAKMARMLRPDEIERHRASVLHYAKLAAQHHRSLSR